MNRFILEYRDLLSNGCSSEALQVETSTEDISLFKNMHVIVICFKEKKTFVRHLILIDAFRRILYFKQHKNCLPIEIITTVDRNIATS